MNRRNDWESLLQIANEAVSEHNCEIIVKKNKDRFYSVSIKHGNDVEEFADNYLEDELSGCIHDAWSIISKRGNNNKCYIVSYVGLSTSESDANGYNEVFLFDSFEDARKKMLALFESERESVTEMGDIPYANYKYNYACVSWAGGEEEVKIYIHEVQKA